MLDSKAKTPVSESREAVELESTRVYNVQETLVVTDSQAVVILMSHSHTIIFITSTRST